MKSRNVVLLLSLVIIFFQSCIPSLHPLYTKDKLVMKQELLGDWIDELGIQKQENKTQKFSIPSQKNTLWNFKANKDKSYRLIYIDGEGMPATFDAHLISLGQNYYLNFHPSVPTKEEKELYPDLGKTKFNELEILHYYPLHTFAKVSFGKDQISIALFDGSFIEDLLDKNRIRIKHEKLNDDYILTAQPKELQQFIIKYADDKEAFPEPIVLKKAI